MSEHNDAPANVLVVEDNPGDVRLIKEAFKEGNVAHTLHIVPDGIDALDYIYQRGNHEDVPPPDIILLDLNLPRKNGEEVLEEIRADDDLPHIPVIILTSSADQKDVVQSYDLCANAYLTKPVNPDEFIETIRLLERFWLEVVELPPEDTQ